MPEAPTSAPLLARRWVRVAAGLALLGLCTALALATWSLPYVEIQAGPRQISLNGSVQTANLHLVLVVTGGLGALLALAYAVTLRPMRYTFLAVGGIALAFTGLLWLGAYHTVRYGQIADPEIYRQVHALPVKMSVGPALWTSLGTAIGILLVSVVVWLAGAHAPDPERDSLRRLRTAGQSSQR